MLPSSVIMFEHVWTSSGIACLLIELEVSWVHWPVQAVWALRSSGRGEWGRKWKIVHADRAISPMMLWHHEMPHFPVYTMQRYD